MQELQLLAQLQVPQKAAPLQRVQLQPLAEIRWKESWRD